MFFPTPVAQESATNHYVQGPLDHSSEDLANGLVADSKILSVAN